MPLMQSTQTNNNKNQPTKSNRISMNYKNPPESCGQAYRPRGNKHVEVDYTITGFQEVYLLRYFFPHSLFVPSILDFLYMKDAYEIKDEYGLKPTAPSTFYLRSDLGGIPEDPHNNESFPNHRKSYEYFFSVISDMLGRRSINASFFGCGPCPELCGLRKYLESNTALSQIEISASMHDIKPWRLKYDGILQQFQTDLAGNLNADSENCVQTSDLITIQCCLNEVNPSKHEQLLKNLAHIVDNMKSEALLLIIERSGYGVNQLLRNLNTELTNKFDNIQIIFHSWSLARTDFNDFNRCIPEELKNHLFTQNANGLRLANKIEYCWLAISKQGSCPDSYTGLEVVPQPIPVEPDFYDLHAGLDSMPCPPIPVERDFYDPYAGIYPIPRPPMVEEN